MSNKYKKNYRFIDTTPDRERESLTLLMGCSDKNKGVLGIKEIIDKDAVFRFVNT